TDHRLCRLTAFGRREPESRSAMDRCQSPSFFTAGKVGFMRLVRAEVSGSPRVLLEGDGSYSLARAGGREFEDVPALLASGARIETGDAVAPGSLLPVVGRPGKIICIGRNYGAHAAERGAAVPDHPMLFPKWHTT